MINFVLRSATDSDIPFIMSTWLKSARKQGDRAFMTNTVYYQNEKRRVMTILERAPVTVLCNAADPDHLIGWFSHQLFADVFILHYAYTKKDYQGQGYMTKAIKSIYPNFGKEEVGITDISPIVSERRQKYALHFNPFLTQIMS